MKTLKTALLITVLSLAFSCGDQETLSPRDPKSSNANPGGNSPLIRCSTDYKWGFPDWTQTPYPYTGSFESVACYQLKITNLPIWFNTNGAGLRAAGPAGIPNPTSGTLTVYVKNTGNTPFHYRLGPAPITFTAGLAPGAEVAIATIPFGDQSNTCNNTYPFPDKKLNYFEAKRDLCTVNTPASWAFQFQFRVVCSYSNTDTLFQPYYGVFGYLCQNNCI